jgi:hypothetical protein
MRPGAGVAGFGALLQLSKTRNAITGASARVFIDFSFA